MNLRIKKNPLARVAFRNFVLCLCLLASTAHATAQEVVYELVTNASQLVAGEKYIFVDVTNKTAMGWYDTDNHNRKAAILNDGNFDGKSIVKNISIAKVKSDQTSVYEFVLYQNISYNKVKWGFFDCVHMKFLCAYDRDDKNGMKLVAKNTNIENPVPNVAKTTITFDDSEIRKAKIMFSLIPQHYNLTLFISS